MTYPRSTCPKLVHYGLATSLGASSLHPHPHIVPSLPQDSFCLITGQEQQRQTKAVRNQKPKSIAHHFTASIQYFVASTESWLAEQGNTKLRIERGGDRCTVVATQRTAPCSSRASLIADQWSLDPIILGESKSRAGV